MFLCNPSNPTGLYYTQEVIVPILIQCERQNCTLIVDEAFHDFVMDYEPLAPLLQGIQESNSITLINENVCHSRASARLCHG